MYRYRLLLLQIVCFCSMSSQWWHILLSPATKQTPTLCASTTGTGNCAASNSHVGPGKQQVIPLLSLPNVSLRLTAFVSGQLAHEPLTKILRVGGLLSLLVVFYFEFSIQHV